MRIRNTFQFQILGFDDQKLEKIYSWKFNFYFLDQKLPFTYPQASTKDAQSTGEAFSPQKRTSITSKHENSVLFFYFCGSFLPSWIRIRNLNADPDPATQINADPDPKPWKKLTQEKHQD